MLSIKHSFSIPAAAELNSPDAAWQHSVAADGEGGPAGCYQYTTLTLTQSQPPLDVQKIILISSQTEELDYIRLYHTYMKSIGCQIVTQLCICKSKVVHICGDMIFISNI